MLGISSIFCCYVKLLEWISHASTMGTSGRSQQSKTKEDAKGMVMDLSFYHLLVFLPIYLLHFRICVSIFNTVDGKNPAPPGMYKKPINNGRTTKLNWLAGFLPSTAS